MSRVEDTLIRMGKAGGADRVNVFAITSCIVITIEFEDGKAVTQTRRNSSGTATDFLILEELNSLSRRYCSCPCELMLLKKNIGRVKDLAHKSERLYYAGNALAAGSFAIFFGGTILDGAVALAVGLLLGAFQKWLSEYISNMIIFHFICSFLLGGLVTALSILFPSMGIDKVMIGDIMLLIPGLALTNSVRDILLGDTISGILQFVQSLLRAGAIAAGSMLSLYLWGG